MLLFLKSFPGESNMQPRSKSGDLAGNRISFSVELKGSIIVTIIKRAGFSPIDPVRL